MPLRRSARCRPPGRAGEPNGEDLNSKHTYSAVKFDCAYRSLRIFSWHSVQSCLISQPIIDVFALCKLIAAWPRSRPGRLVSTNFSPLFFFRRRNRARTLSQPANCTLQSGSPTSSASSAHLSMDPHIDPDAHISNHGQGASPVLSSSQVITPTKSKSRGLLADLAGWPSYSDMRIQAPGSENSGGLHHPGNLTRCADPSLPLCIVLWMLILAV